MQKFKDVFGDDVFLDDEVKKIILAKHPEVSKFIKRISLVLNDPETIKSSTVSKRAKLYYRYFEDIYEGKFLVVVVKEVDQKFISTFYVTDKIKEGEILWQKNP
jgi:hypothetical protein